MADQNQDQQQHQANEQQDSHQSLDPQPNDQQFSETEQAEEKEALRERERQANQKKRNLNFLGNTRKLVILHKNAEQYPKEESEFKWNERYEVLLDQLKTAFDEKKVKEQFEIRLPQISCWRRP